MKITAFWDMVPFSVIVLDWCFRGAYCLQMEAEAMLASQTPLHLYEATHCNFP
jgi:hypothetical protein